jgi:hypothetical protein
VFCLSCRWYASRHSAQIATMYVSFSTVDEHRVQSKHCSTCISFVRPQAHRVMYFMHMNIWLSVSTWPAQATVPRLVYHSDHLSTLSLSRECLAHGAKLSLYSSPVAALVFRNRLYAHISFVLLCLLLMAVGLTDVLLPSFDFPSPFGCTNRTSAGRV